MLRAGYDQTFEQLADQTSAGGSRLGRGYARTVVDAAGSAVTLPAGVGIDPGGIGLALVFTGVHVLAVAADSYVHFSLLNVLVPLTVDWHPVAVAWGIVGSYLLLAVELTSLARTRLPRTLWRRVHYASFLLFAATTVHGLSAGTDARSPAFLIANVAVCGLVLALAAARVLQSARYPSVAATLPSQNRQVRAAR